MTKFAAPMPAGYIHPTTGRVAVLVSSYANSDLNGDAPAYWFDREAEEIHLDPWRLIEGVDPHTQATEFDIWFASGSSKRVGPAMTIFLQAEHAAVLAPLPPLREVLNVSLADFLGPGGQSLRIAGESASYHVSERLMDAMRAEAAKRGVSLASLFVELRKECV